MSFADDFDSIAGSVTDSFKTIWSTLQTKPTIPVPGVTGAASGSGVGSALQKPAAGNPTTTTIYIIGGAVAIVLIFALLLVRPSR